MEIKQRIILKAQQLFEKLGIRNVSMDDVARELGISKKTIYQHFEDKATLIREGAKLHLEKECVLMQQLVESSENALEAILKIMTYVHKKLKSISPLLIFEMQKYYPEIWQLMREQDEKINLPALTHNLEKGIKEGLYRPDINVEVVARLRLALVEASLDERIFPSDKFNQNEIQIQVSNFYLYGLLTEKGQQQLAIISKQLSVNS
jgi:AcrR family transcriptional regulator